MKFIPKKPLTIKQVREAFCANQLSCDVCCFRGECSELIAEQPLKFAESTGFIPIDEKTQEYKWQIVEKKMELYTGREIAIIFSFKHMIPWARYITKKIDGTIIVSEDADIFMGGRNMIFDSQEVSINNFCNAADIKELRYTTYDIDEILNSSQKKEVKKTDED